MLGLAWPVIGQAFEAALTGKTSYLENQRMFLDRNGYLRRPSLPSPSVPFVTRPGLPGCSTR